jgi:hypothetical protein
VKQNQCVQLELQFELQFDRALHVAVCGQQQTQSLDVAAGAHARDRRRLRRDLASADDAAAWRSLAARAGRRASSRSQLALNDFSNFASETCVSTMSSEQLNSLALRVAVGKRVLERFSEP